jgi:hypothetical protein
MTDLTRYSLFSQKVQLDPITNQPQARVISGKTLLDHFIPGEQLYLAQNNEYTTQAEIEDNAPPGTKLLLVDRNDLIYGSEAAAAELKKVLPIDYLAGAYASVFKGGCMPMNPTRSLKVAVVDFGNNYDSGSANIPAEISRQFVHDSCGAIDAKLLKDLANRQNAIQFRFGLNGENPTFGKGMLNPIDFDKLFPNGNAPDLILSSDSFKGNKVAPGLYEYSPDELFLGIKNNAQRTSASLSELINIYPQAAADVLPIVHAQAQILAANSKDVVTIAAQALNDYYLDGMQQDDPSDELANANTQDDFKTPKLIEMALKSGRYNLLDSKQVQDWLGDRINASWKNLSYGDIPQLNSNNATVLPAYDLKYGEVAVPWLADGEELIFYRSPIVNRNGIVTVRNNLSGWQGLKELGADPNVMYVNVQTLDRIELEDPTTYANLLEQYGSKEKLELGFQTLMEATQMDFDGDTGNGIERSTVPHLHEAVKLNEHPDRKLRNFHKSEKNLPTDWTLPQIAEHIRPGYVGVVYSHKRQLEFSRGEIDLAIARNDVGLMDRFADDYFTKARKLLFKSTIDGNLSGRSISTGADASVTLDPNVRAAAAKFVNAFDELEIVEQHEAAGGFFVLDKMARLRHQLQFLKTDKTYQFTSSTGEIKQAFSPKLLQAIDSFDRLPLKELWSKTDKLEELKDYLTRYQKLSQLIEREVDLSQPIELIGSFQKFDRKTNRTVQTNYSETVEQLSLAAPKTTTTERLRLYQSVLDECIVVTSQLNQDAVDVFKSANIIHDEISHVLSTECARDTYSSISGKTRLKAYQDGQQPQPTGYTLPDLLQDLCNQHYQTPFESKQQVSNPDLMRSFRDIPVSSQASAIAQFHLSDDQQIIDRLKEIGYIQRLNNGKKAYLDITVGNSSVKLLNLNSARFKSFKESGSDSIILDFDSQQALTYPHTESDRLASLDPRVCESLAQKYPSGLAISQEKFISLIEAGKIDLHFIRDDKKEIGAERKDNLQNLRQAFANEGIEPLEALAALAQGTNRSRAGYLIAAYPDALTEHIKSIPIDNLIFNAIDPEAKELVNRAVKAMGNNPFEFQIRTDGKLLIEAPGNLTLDFLGNLPETGKYQIDNRIKTSSSLPPGVVAEGNLVTEAYCFSLKLKGPGQGLIATNLTTAGKKITNTQQRSAVDLALSLDPVRTLPYAVNIMGMDCPISHASSGLAEILATEIDGNAELEFKEFKYNPLNQGTGKPSFSAVLERDGVEYYLSGIIPEQDSLGRKVTDLQPHYFVKQNFSRQVSQSASVVTGYTLNQNVAGIPVKLGDITIASARQVGILADLTHNSALEGSVLPVPIPHSMMAKVQDRLQIDNPEKIYNSALWEVSTPGKLYSPALPLGKDLKTKIDVCRSKSLNDLSANPLLVTRTQQPVIVNSTVEFQEFYQISCPDRKVASVKAFLDLPQQNGKNIPYRFHASDEHPHPAYEPEYQRGYSVFLVEPEAVRKKGNNKADPLIVRIKQLVDADIKQPLDPQAYERQLQAAKVVRPIVAKNLQDLGGWLQDTGGFTTEPPEIDIDNLTRLPYALAGIGEEARARFHARAGLTEDKQHTVFYFGSEYLRDRFVSNMGNAPLPLDCPSQKSRLALVYAAVVPTADLASYLKEDRHQYSYNCDADGQKINPILSTYNVNKLSSLATRAATDISMGFAANKYIGKSLLNSPSRTDLYQDSYAENANTDRYKAGDVVMVSGNRFDGKSVIRSTLKPFFEQNYLPLLKAARQAKATIVFGDGNSVDALAKKYLEQSGYTVLEHPHGYNEAVPQERANERKQELAGVIAQSPFQPDLPIEPIEPVEPPKLEIPVYTRKKSAAAPAGMSLA